MRKKKHCSACHLALSGAAARYDSVIVRFPFRLNATRQTLSGWFAHSVSFYSLHIIICISSFLSHPFAPPGFDLVMRLGTSGRSNTAAGLSRKSFGSRGKRKKSGGSAIGIKRRKDDGPAFSVGVGLTAEVWPGARPRLVVEAGGRGLEQAPAGPLGLFNARSGVAKRPPRWCAVPQRSQHMHACIVFS